MKKITTFMITFILLFSCLGLTTFAENSSISLSDDYQKLYVDGKSYSRFNASLIDVPTHEVESDIALSSTQQETVEEIYLDRNDSGNIYYATINFLDGSSLTVSFLQDDYLEEYQQMTSGQIEEYIIDFSWPEENAVPASKTDLMSSPVTLTKAELEWADTYYVLSKNKDESLIVFVGSLMIIENDYYYVNFSEINIRDRYKFLPYDYETLSAYKITNTTLIAEIQKAENAFYEDNLGFLYNDDLTEKISAVMMIALFGVLPFAILVLFLICALRSKTVYKKMFLTTSILSFSVLIVFGIVLGFIMNIN